MYTLLKKESYAYECTVGAARPRLTYLISTFRHILKSFSTCGGMQIYFPILLSLPANKLAREQLTMREEQLGHSRSAKQNQTPPVHKQGINKLYIHHSTQVHC